MAAAEVFMDTAGFLALWDAGDQHHAAALRVQQELIRKYRHFLTTEYVADETITLLLARHSHRAATDFLDTIERSEALRLVQQGGVSVDGSKADLKTTVPTTTEPVIKVGKRLYARIRWR